MWFWKLPGLCGQMIMWQRQRVLATNAQSTGLDGWVQGPAPGGTEPLHSWVTGAWRSLAESPYSLAPTIHSPPGLIALARCGQRRSPERSWPGRPGSKKAEGHEGVRRHVSAELLDVKLGTWPSKKKLWLRSQTQETYSQSCQTPDWLTLQTEADITTSLAEHPRDKGLSPGAEPSPKHFHALPLHHPPYDSQAPGSKVQAFHYTTTVSVPHLPWASPMVLHTQAPPCLCALPSTRNALLLIPLLHESSYSLFWVPEGHIHSSLQLPHHPVVEPPPPALSSMCLQDRDHTKLASAVPVRGLTGRMLSPQRVQLQGRKP